MKRKNYSEELKVKKKTENLEICAESTKSTLILLKIVNQMS